MQENQNKISHLFGVGLDNKDEHQRITQGDKFSIVGGSEQTHEIMSESVIKTFEDLKRKGKALEETSAEELKDLLRKNTQQ